jgi:hypothetical protein
MLAIMIYLYAEKYQSFRTYTLVPNTLSKQNNQLASIKVLIANEEIP